MRAAAGVVVLDAPDPLQARFKATVYRKDRGLEFASGHKLHPLSTITWRALHVAPSRTAIIHSRLRQCNGIGHEGLLSTVRRSAIAAADPTRGPNQNRCRADGASDFGSAAMRVPPACALNRKFTAQRFTRGILYATLNVGNSF
jgi:hypothetical protein